MRLARWSIAVAAVLLLLAASVALTACGSASDPFSGTWLGPPTDPGSGRVVLRIKKANEGWWAVEAGSATSRGKPFYAARFGDELQLPNRVEWMTVDGDKLTVTVSGAPDYPAVFTRQ